VEKGRLHKLRILTDDEEINLWIDEDHTLLEHLIRHGMRAVKGAIESIVIDRDGT